jgi:preprotein translocase subunit SecB
MSCRSLAQLMTSNERELYEVVIALQAEISALKELMFQASIVVPGIRTRQ